MSRKRLISKLNGYKAEMEAILKHIKISEDRLLIDYSNGYIDEDMAIAINEEIEFMRERYEYLSNAILFLEVICDVPPIPKVELPYMVFQIYLN